MKISKLFHWLYAFLMALPIFAVLSACLISTFNMSSKQESEINYRFETNDVNRINDLVIGNIYKVNYLRFWEYCNITGNDYHIFGTSYFKTFNVDSNTTEIVYFSTNETYVNQVYNDRYFVFDNDSSGLLTLETIVGFDSGVYDINFNNSYFYVEYTSNTLLYTDFDTTLFLTKADYIPIESVDINNVATQDIFYNAIDKVKQSPLFSWAYDSFLVAPFAYIVSLFSMPANSFVVQMLSYWLAISIIWLVFDLVMYVPLLVHRWLDKGVLE